MIVEGNVGIGTWAPRDKLDIVNGNVGIGTGFSLVGIGTTSTILTLRNDTSSVYLGWQSGPSTTVIGFNQAVGNQSLMNNTTGTGNTAVGYNALNSNTTSMSIQRWGIMLLAIIHGYCECRCR